jgi:hypothetical protein
MFHGFTPNLCLRKSDYYEAALWKQLNSKSERIRSYTWTIAPEAPRSVPAPSRRPLGISTPAPADPFKANCRAMSPEWRHPETNGPAGLTIIRMQPDHATRSNASIGATA